MNGHWAGTTDEELRAIRERPHLSPTVSEPRTDWECGQAKDGYQCSRPAGHKGMHRKSIPSTAVIFAQDAARAEAAQPIDVERLGRELNLLPQWSPRPEYKDRVSGPLVSIPDVIGLVARLRASDTDQ